MLHKAIGKYYFYENQFMVRALIDKAFPNFSNELKDDLVKSGEWKTFESGQVLARAGYPIKCTYILLDGIITSAMGATDSPENMEFVVMFLKPGHGFAVSISEDSPSANKISRLNFTALETCQVLALPYTDKDRMAMHYNEWYRYILQTTVMYYGYYLELIDSIAFKKLDNRIEDYLIRLSQAMSSKQLKISHQEIANHLNSSREVISRLLKKMEDAGKIRLGHQLIIIL